MSHDFSIQGFIEQRKNENCNAIGDHNPLISNLGVTKNILSFDCSLIVAKRQEKHPTIKICGYDCSIMEMKVHGGYTSNASQVILVPAYIRLKIQRKNESTHAWKKGKSPDVHF